MDNDHKIYRWYIFIFVFKPLESVISISNIFWVGNTENNYFRALGHKKLIIEVIILKNLHQNFFDSTN